MAEMVEVGCMCCDRPISIRSEVIGKMAMPMVFCSSCHELYDPMFKRLCVKLSMLTRTVAYHHSRMSPAQ
jgi:hypothetical protein